MPSGSRKRHSHGESRYRNSTCPKRFDHVRLFGEDGADTPKALVVARLQYTGISHTEGRVTSANAATRRLQSAGTPPSCKRAGPWRARTAAATMRPIMCEVANTAAKVMPPARASPHRQFRNTRSNNTRATGARPRPIS